MLSTPVLWVDYNKFVYMHYLSYIQYICQMGITYPLNLMSPSGAQGYVYSTFLKQYNPLRDPQRGGQVARDQQPDHQQQQPVMVEEDFDDISLFVSGSGSSSLRSFSLNTTDSCSTLSGLQGEPDNPEDQGVSVDGDDVLDDTQQVLIKCSTKYYQNRFAAVVPCDVVTLLCFHIMASDH